jgi:hypothetical protein
MVNGDAPSLPRVIGVWGARSGSTQGENRTEDVAQQAFATSGTVPLGCRLRLSARHRSKVLEMNTGSPEGSRTG